MKKNSQLAIATYNLIFRNGTTGGFGSGNKFQLDVMEVLHTVAMQYNWNYKKYHVLIGHKTTTYHTA